MAKVLGDADVGWTAAPKKKTLSDADVGWSTSDAIDQSALDTQSTFGAIKDVGLGALKNLGKAGVAAVDFLAGIPGQAVGVGADIGARTYGAVTGESKRNISEAGRIAAEQIPTSIGLSKTPATDFMKRLGVEEYNQEGVAQALDTFAKGVAKRTGGLLDQNDIMSLFDTAMMAGGAHGVDAGVKAAITKPKEIGAANRGTYVGQEAPKEAAPQPTLRDQINSRLGIRTPEEQAAATKAKGKEVASAFKDTETADALAAQAEGPQAIWRGPDHDMPVEVTGKPERGPDGKLYTPVRYNGQDSYAPSAELQFTQRAAPTGEEIGSTGQFEQSGAAGPVQPKSRIGETPIVGEPIPALNSALAKVKEGRTFDMTAEERIALREFKNSPDRIQKGAIDPELLSWMALGGVAATIGGVELTRYLREKEREDKQPAPKRDYPIKGPDGETLAGLGILTAGVLRGKFKGSHESVILKAAQEGNPEAFGEIYRREAPRLERVASRYVQDTAQAKDLVQEAMISAYKALPEFKGESKLSTWLHRIVVNKALNRVEAEGRQIKGEELSPEVEQHVAGDSRTPQQELQNKQLGEALQAGLDKLPLEFREAFELRELHGLDYEAIAEKQGVSRGTAASRIARAKEALQGHLKEYGGKYATVAGVAGATALLDGEATAENTALAAAILAVKAKGGMWHPEAVTRLAEPLGDVLQRNMSSEALDVFSPMRRGPRREQGSVDKNLVIGLGAIGAGATVGMAALGSLIDSERPLQNAFYGALAGAAFGTQLGRATLKEAIKSPDKTLGLVSTRLYNIAPALRRQLRRHENRVLKAVDAANDQALPFIQALGRLPKEVKAKIDNALLNGKTEALQQIPELAQTYPAVRKLLGSIEGQLQALGRFGEGVSNYFPRLVKDFEGLREAIGLDASVGLEKRLLEAEAKMIKKEGRSLTDVEQSIIANRYLFSADETSFQPGFAKSRKMRDVPEHLQKFYAPPTESLLRYITGATNDLEIARFFGKDLATKKGGKKLFNDVDGSIGNLTARLLSDKSLTQAQAMELRDILKARFEGGEQGMSPGLAAIRNITNTGLLGNVASAATQIGDSLMTIYHHGLVPTLQATAQTILGKQRITPKQLGLINHVAEELSEMGKTGRALHVAMKYSGFHAVDMFAKGLGLNAALIKNTKLVATPAGEAKFRAKYQTSFEGDTNALIRDLKEGRSSDLVDELVFSELSDAQPISKAEMPELYLRHPNGRLLYQLKTYMLKQTDIIRRDAYQEIAKGTAQGIMTGTKNLAALATVYAFANVPGDIVKDYISGRDTDPLATPKLVENVFQTFGINRYAAQQIGQGKVVETAIGMATPPVRVMQDIAKLNGKSVAYVPFIGRPVYDRFLGGNEKREIYETRVENAGKPKADRKPLSPAAKEYLRKQREEKKAKGAR